MIKKMANKDSANSHLSPFRRNIKDTFSHISINPIGLYLPPAETGGGGEKTMWTFGS